MPKPKDYFLNLSKYRKNVFSQNGEDGIVSKLLEMINIEKGWCCEFGAVCGKELSNTYNLTKNKNWKAVLIEQDDERFKKLQQTQNKHPENIIAIKETVHYLPGKGKLLDDILSSTPIPQNFDLLSIDVDGPDYHIWKSLKKYKPKIVIIETSSLAGDFIQVKDGIHGGPNRNGSTSLGPIKKLGEEKGYRLLIDTGNAIFLDEEIAQAIKEI